MAVLSNVLAPSIVTGIVSRIKTPGDYLQTYFGMHIGGPNTNTVEARAYSWDIFDNVRDIAMGRAPGTGPTKIAVNPVGRQTNTFPRTYEKLECNYELLANIRTLGQDAGTRDRMGAVYLENQARQLKRRATNFREFQLAALFTNGTASWQFDGDNWIPVLTLGSNLGFTLDWLIPSGNKNIYTGAFTAGLNPLGSGNIITATWATAGTNIPGNLDSINQAFQQLVGAPLALVITDSTIWNNVLNNTTLQAQGGSVNPVFSQYDMEPITGPDGNKIGVFVARLRARPWLKWLILDTGLNINGTYTRWWGGNLATFLIDPADLLIKMQEGGEPVKDSPWAPASWRTGLHTWIREWDEPARIELHALMNCVVELPIPKGIMISRVA